MRRRIPLARTVLTGLAAICLVAAPVLAQGGPMGQGPNPHGPHDPGMMIRHMADQLELTEAQRDQVRAILEQNKAANQGNREAVRLAHEALAELLHAETFDEVAIRAVADDLAAAQTEMLLSHAWIVRDLRGVLTPEQLEEFQQMQGQRKGANKGARRGSGHGGHGHGRHDCSGSGSDDGDTDE